MWFCLHFTDLELLLRGRGGEREEGKKKKSLLFLLSSLLRSSFLSILKGFAMENHISLEDWELLSDFDTNSVAFEEIIHSDYFALDSTKLHAKNERGLKEIEFSEKNSMIFQPQTEKGGYFLADDVGMGLDGIDPSARNCDVVDSNDELGIGEINKGGSFFVDDSKKEVGVEGIMNSDAGKGELGIEGIAKGDSFQANDPTMALGFEETELSRHQSSPLVDSEHKLGIQEIQKGGSFMVSDSEMEVGIEEIDSISQNSDGASNLKELKRENNDEKSQESDSDSSIEMSNSESISVGGGEKKVLIWWKLPLDILKLCASRVKPVWSIPIAAAVIGILMVGRRLYKMKHRSVRIPLKVSFEEKKAASQLLLRAARLNEVAVRRVPVIGSPLLLAGGLTPWPVVGLL